MNKKLENITKNKTITNKIKNEEKTKKTYMLKPPLEVNCMECQKTLTVLFCPPHQGYSNKNHWDFWTQKSKDEGKYKCNKCVIEMYKNRKFEYLKEITDSKKRRLLRHYFYANKEFNLG